MKEAAEFLKLFRSGFDGLLFEHETERSIVEYLMIEFAKIHVKAALEAADVQAENLLPEGCWDLLEDVNFIKNSYPDSNIK